MKNVVLMPWIEREEAVNKSGIGSSDRTKGYKYGVDSWKQWCEKHDVEFFLMDTLLVPESEMVITWQRWYVLEILEKNGIEYDQVLLVDADCIPHPNCPDFFKLTDHKFSTSFCNGDFEWVNRAIKDYSRIFFNTDYLMMASDFFQTGFVILNKSHEKFLKYVIDFYWKNKDIIIESYETIRTGSDQPLINLLSKKFGVEVNFLPNRFSMIDLFRKNILYTDPRCWWQDDLSNLYNTCYIYQFNAIPPNPMNRNRDYWMERIYKELYK
jgi:hypothetical protein